MIMKTDFYFNILFPNQASEGYVLLTFHSTKEEVAMNVKKVCRLITVTAMLFFGLPAMPFANVDQVPPLSQEELGLVFQNPDRTWNGKLDFLKYLDEEEMKETKGKAAHIVAGGVVGGIVGGVGAWWNGSSVGYGITTGALVGSGVAAGVGALSGWGIGTRIMAGAGLTLSGSGGAYGGCAFCHSVRPQGGH